MATPTDGNGNMMDEFEEAFLLCINSLTKDDSGPDFFAVEKDDSLAEVDLTIPRFIEIAHQMEAFFLQKRFLLSALKPELVVKEDTLDMRHELSRKDELIKRLYDKIAVWQNLLADLQGWEKTGAQGQGTPPNPGQVGNPQGAGPSPAPAPNSTPPQSGPPSAMMQQQLQQQQIQQQQMQQQQMQQQMQSQMPGPGVVGGPIGPPQQGMFMQQPRGPPFPGQGPGGLLQGPLAYLEKTTSNIGMPDGRR